MATLIRSDLDFILQQIFIAEANAAGASLISLLPNELAMLGLRTVDGSLNNLVPGQQFFGAADLLFPRVLGSTFNSAEIIPAGFFGTHPVTGELIPPVDTPTSYLQTSGLVLDSQPRIISNLIVDQTPLVVDPITGAYVSGNPAASAAGGTLVTSPGLDGIFGTADDRDVLFIPNTAPDEGLSAGFNSWFTFFGQFFDHGLDLVNKGGNGVIMVPLQPDDPLFDPTPGAANFMMLTRATQVEGPGADGILVDDAATVANEAADNTFHEAVNQTTPFVDQNQTYTSHPSHQVFLREYVLDVNGRPIATGMLLEGDAGGLATWADIKFQARTVLGIELDDFDVHDVPLVMTDAYGNFIPDTATGMPQLVTGPGTVLVGNLLVPIDATAAVNTGHAFLNDIAHAAAPNTGEVIDTDLVAGPIANPAFNPNLPEGPLNMRFLAQPDGTYDDELLNAHFATGDGRGNENIALTSVHHVFHSEHNRQIDEIRNTLVADAIASGNVAFLNDWLTTDVLAPPALTDILTLSWDGERLFQAAKFATEMQYQHLVFEEFARKVQPNVDAFLNYDATINPAIVAEFAHVVYRFGHSMLTETIDRFDPLFNVIGNPNGLDPAGQQMGLISAFLNPLAFLDDGTAAGMTADAAAGAIVRGMTRQAGNEIDEFVTEAVRNNLLGLPLDLPSINILRGRDTGVPTLNEARRDFFENTSDAQLKPYVSWVDLAVNLKHAESVINFIAAYGTHAELVAADVDTLVEKRDVATALVMGGSAVINAGALDERTFVADDADRAAFLNSTGTYANLATGVTTTGVDDIDLWIGGLAERQMPFGGLLGSTFNFVFETQ
ncbi:MAG: peroxidase family protein, partial [Burkholderiales bacterium]